MKSIGCTPKAVTHRLGRLRAISNGGRGTPTATPKKSNAATTPKATPKSTGRAKKRSAEDDDEDGPPTPTPGKKRGRKVKQSESVEPEPELKKIKREPSNDFEGILPGSEDATPGLDEGGEAFDEAEI